MKDEQTFYVVFGKGELFMYTLAELKSLAKEFITPGTTFDKPIFIGTRWQGWPVDA